MLQVHQPRVVQRRYWSRQRELPSLPSELLRRPVVIAETAFCFPRTDIPKSIWGEEAEELTKIEHLELKVGWTKRDRRGIMSAPAIWGPELRTMQ